MNIIFDTDMGGDCDDVDALFIQHGAVERGEAKLLATMGCISSEVIAPAIDAINTWFGRPEITVGTLKDPGFLPGPHYTAEIAKLFPHKFPGSKDYPDAAALLCSTWPTPVLFNGEGGSTCSGRRVMYEMPEHNPLTMAYANYPGVGLAGDRLSWDPISALVTIRGAEPWYKVIRGGANVTEAAKGLNTWQTAEDRGYSYLVLKCRKALRAMDASSGARLVAH